MPYDYDEIQKAKERRIMWICLGIALLLAVVAGLIIYKHHDPMTEEELMKDEAFKKGYYDPAARDKTYDQDRGL